MAIQNVVNLEEGLTPYTINSFFRTSDENPFSGADSPRLTVKLNNATASSSSMTIRSHDVTCVAVYAQNQFVQWKSYQWTLTSADGKEIYDQTPVGYDNEIKAHFYGLKNGSSYNIVLTIETNDNRVITETRPIYCAVSTSSGNTPDWVNVSSDCNGYYNENGDNGENCVTINTGGVPADIYKCEIWPSSGGGEEEPVCHLVALNCTIAKDYAVSNHRWYKYIIHPTPTSAADSDVFAIIQTSWVGWTLTELVPVSQSIAHYPTYAVSAKDVWKFKYNISAGAQTHNLNKTPYNTLSKYPHFSFGATDYMSGSVTCLLGREIIPFDVSPAKAKYEFNPQTGWGWTSATPRGGYTEVLPNNQAGFRDLSSNEKINMLEAWKRFCYSGNPKLLKDEKGNSYIVQILNTSSETQTNIYGRPEQISFEWQQIGNARNLIAYSAETQIVGYTLTFAFSSGSWQLDVLSSVLIESPNGAQRYLNLRQQYTQDLTFYGVGEITIVNGDEKHEEVQYQFDNAETEEQLLYENDSWSCTLTNNLTIKSISN